MANANIEDLSNRNLDKPIIRTMENDLRSLKSDLSPKEIFKNLAKAPGNLPVDLRGPASAKPPSAPADQRPFAGPKFSVPEPEAAAPPPESREIPASKQFQQQRQINRQSVSKPVASVPRDERQAPEISKQEPVIPAPGAVPEIKTEKPRPSYIPSFIPPSPPSRIERKPRESYARPAFKSPRPEPPFKTAEAPASRPHQYAIPREEENLPPEARLAMQSFVSGQVFEKAAGNGNSAPTPPSAPSQSYKFYDREEPRDGSVLGKILKYAIIIIALAGVLYGIYYFGVLKRPSASLPETAGELLVAGANPIEIKANLDAEALGAIKKYFQSEALRKSPGVYRIVLRDESGNKVLAENSFKNALKTSFPAGVADALDNGYNLVAFSYPQKNYLRLGMILKIKDAGSLSRQLSAWEPSMSKNLESLFLGNAAMVAPAQNFKNNMYKDASIRYLPIGPEDAALNYAVDKNKKFLLIATSKGDIFYLIDSISQ